MSDTNLTPSSVVTPSPTPIVPSPVRKGKGKAAVARKGNGKAKGKGNGKAKDNGKGKGKAIATHKGGGRALADFANDDVIVIVKKSALGTRAQFFRTVRTVAQCLLAQKEGKLRGRRKAIRKLIAAGAIALKPKAVKVTKVETAATQPTA
jgi:hypothetical protein